MVQKTLLFLEMAETLVILLHFKWFISLKKLHTQLL